MLRSSVTNHNAPMRRPKSMLKNGSARNVFQYYSSARRARELNLLFSNRSEFRAVKFRSIHPGGFTRAHLQVEAIFNLPAPPDNTREFLAWTRGDGDYDFR